MKITIKKEFGNIVPYSLEDKEKLDKFADGVAYEVDIKNFDVRTLKQNASIHKWCELISSYLNSQNLTIQDVLKVESEWTMLKVKENIFKPVVKSLYNKDSTTKLEKKDFDLIIDTITRAFGSKGIEIPAFPSSE